MSNEWIIYGKPFLEMYNEDLNKAGTLIEVEIPNYVFNEEKHRSYKKGTKKQKFLIGDININGGICDDCVSFEDICIVVRYKVLVTEDNMKQTIRPDNLMLGYKNGDFTP